MDCIPYIEDLKIEIKILKDIKENSKCDVEKINKQIEEKEKLINNCKENLSKLSDNKIEYKIYLFILNGMKPTQAICKIADYNLNNNISPMSLTQLWRIYNNMKKKLENTKMVVK